MANSGLGRDSDPHLGDHEEGMGLSVTEAGLAYPDRQCQKPQSDDRYQHSHKFIPPFFPDWVSG